MSLDNLDELWAMSPAAREEIIGQTARQYVRDTYMINPEKFCKSRSLQEKSSQTPLDELIQRWQWRARGGDERWLDLGQIWIKHAHEEFQRLCSSWLE